MTENVVWHNTKVTRSERERLNDHKGLCVWFTGMSGSGKSTIATTLEQRLHHLGIRTYLLDGDNLRHGLNADLGFSEDDRKENVRRVAQVSKLFVDAGVVVMTALISPFREDRQLARSLFEVGSFTEVYVDCPLEVCATRDPKGLYKKANMGLIQNFTGISSPYEIPANPEVHLRTDVDGVEKCVEGLFAHICSQIRPHRVVIS